MSKKRTTEEFIEEAKKVHGNKYDYSKVNYINNRTKVCIVCPEHGEFWQTPGSHLNNGNGCPLCGNKSCSEKKRKSINIFIKQAKEIHGEKYNYTKVDYIGNHEKVIIICPEHGEFLQSPNKHLQGCGCPKCANNVKSNTKEFIEKAKKIHGNKYDYSKVEYINCHTNVCIICPEHGKFWQTPSTHLRGNGCSKCSGKAKSNTEEFIKKAQLIHGNKYDYSETVYISAAKKVKITCPLHGEFYVTGNNHLCGCGCPKCILKSQNKLFEKLKESLQEELIWEYTTDWLEKQRIDIFIPKYNIGIEYHGIQHYEPVDAWGGEDGLKINQQRDTLKLEKCNNHGVKLLYLKYDYSEQDFENLVQDIHKIIENNT